ncbi:MAG: gfo/Idh/MocA family oxidoreductase, partial [Pirellulaceae bacterium]
MKRPSKARRQFLKTSAAVSAGYWVAGGVSPKESRSAIEEVRFACVGVGGKGQSDSDDAARAGKIVAICDIDDSTIAKRKEDDKFKDAKVFHDFRKLFDEVGNSIDAVTVS